jgi:hypothetical protein
MIKAEVFIFTCILALQPSTAGADENMKFPHPFREGLKWGYIDEKGKTVIPMQFDDAGYFSGGYAVVYKDGEYFYITPEGKRAFPPGFENAKPFSEGLAGVEIMTDHRVAGFINIKGEMAIRAEYDRVNPFHEGVAVCFRDYDDAVIIDGAGKVLAGLVLPPMEEYRCSQGLIVFPVRQGDSDMLYGFVDAAGKTVIEPAYYCAFPFSEGLARIWIKGEKKWVSGRLGNGYEDTLVQTVKTGFIDRTGALTIGAEYDGGTDFSDGLAAVMKDENWGFIDKNGEVVIPLAFDQATAFSEGFAAVRKNGKWGYIDKSGKTLISLQFGQAEPFIQGLARVVSSVTKGNVKTLRIGLIDKSGKFIRSAESKP